MSPPANSAARERIDELKSKPLSKCFGSNLATPHTRAALSQEILALHARIHRTEVGQLERGLRDAHLDTLVKLAGSLEGEPSELLAGLSRTPAIVNGGQLSVATKG